jgi:hypothetical protein
MSLRNSAAHVPEVEPAEVLPEVSVPAFTYEITLPMYNGRERYAANDAVSGRPGRPGIIAALRDTLRNAGGKTVVLTITTK